MYREKSTTIPSPIAPPATPVVPVVETPIEAPSAPQAQADVTQGDAQPQTTAPDTTFSFQTPPTSPPVSQPQPSADQAQAPLAPQAQAVVPQGAAQPQTTEPASTFSFQTPSSAAPSESAPEPSNGQVEAPAVPQVQAGQASTFSLQPSAPAPQEESELPGTYGQIQGDIPIVPEAPRILPDGASSPQTADQAPIFSLQPPPPAPLPETEFFSGTGQAQDASPDPGPQPEASLPETPQQPDAIVAVPSIPSFGTTSPSQPQAGAAQLPSETQAAVQPTPEPPVDPGGQVFRYPSYRQYRLNYCYRWRKDCGQPAAEAWCKAVGFNRAVSWKKEAHVGAIFPTIVMAEKRLCDKYLCDGFEQIVCGR